MNIFYNRLEGRLTSFWRLLIQFAIYRLLLTAALLDTVGLLVLALSLALAGQIPREALADGQALSDALTRIVGDFALLLSLPPLVGIGLILLFYRLLGRWLDRRPWQEYGLHLSRCWGRDFLVGFALGGGLIGAIFAVEAALGWTTVRGTMASTEAMVPFWPALLNAFLLYLLVAVGEELFARGYLLQNLAEGLNHQRLSPRAALASAYLLSSVIFGLLHADNAHATSLSTVNLVVAGLLFGLPFVLTGELALPIGLHLGWNFFMGNVFGLPVSGAGQGVSLLVVEQRGPELWTGGAFGPEGGLLGLATLLLGLAASYGWIRWAYRRAQPQLELAIFAPAARMPADEKVATDAPEPVPGSITRVERTNA